MEWSFLIGVALLAHLIYHLQGEIPMSEVVARMEAKQQRAAERRKKMEDATGRLQ